MVNDIDNSPENMMQRIVGSEERIYIRKEIVLSDELTADQQELLLLGDENPVFGKEPKQLLGKTEFISKGEETITYPERIFLGEDLDGNSYSIAVDSLVGKAKESHDKRVRDDSTLGDRERIFVPESGRPRYDDAQLFGVELKPENWAALTSNDPSREFYEHAFKAFVGLSPEEMQIAYVRNNGERIAEIKNPTESVKEAAVANNGLAVLDIEKPSDELIETAGRKLGDEIVKKYYPQTQPPEPAAASKKPKLGGEIERD